MLTIAKLRAREVPVLVELDGDTFTVHVRPSALTPKLRSDLRENESAEEGLVQMIAATAVRWDLLTEEGGEPYPLTADALRELPIELLGAVANAIGAALVPNSPSATDSEDP